MPEFDEHGRPVVGTWVTLDYTRTWGVVALVTGHGFDEVIIRVTGERPNGSAIRARGDIMFNWLLPVTRITGYPPEDDPAVLVLQKRPIVMGMLE